MSVLAHLLPTGPISSRDFSGRCSLTSDPWRGGGYPAGVAIVDACAGGCVLGSERRLERPEEHMPRRLRRRLPCIKISKFLLRGDQRSESYVFYSSSTCDMYSRSSSVMELRMYCQRCYSYVRYVLRTASTAAAAQTESCVYLRAVYSRTCDMYSGSRSCDGATHVLSTLLRTVRTTYGIFYSSS